MMGALWPKLQQAPAFSQSPGFLAVLFFRSTVGAKNEMSLMTHEIHALLNPHESLRLLRFRFMTPWFLKIQIHDSRGGLRA